MLITVSCPLYSTMRPSAASEASPEVLLLQAGSKKEVANRTARIVITDLFKLAMCNLSMFMVIKKTGKNTCRPYRLKPCGLLSKWEAGQFPGQPYRSGSIASKP